MYTEKGSTFTYDKNEYNLETLLRDMHKEPVIEVAVSDLSWMLTESKNTDYDKTRFKKADLSAPILVTCWQDRLAVLDGWHRLNKAVVEGVSLLPAKMVTEEMLNKHLILPIKKKPTTMQMTNTDPYSLTTTRPIRIAAIREDVAKQAIADRNDHKLFRIVEGHGGISEFEHPLLFKTPGVDGWRVAIDLRSYRGNSPMVREQIQLLERRAILTLHAAEKDGSEALFEVGLMLAYVTNLTGLLSKQYGLDPLIKMHLAVVACAFYYFITRKDGHVFNDEDFLVITKQATRHLNVPSELATSVITRLTPGRDLNALCASIKEIEGTDRTIMLSPAALINCCNGLWFGVNKDQLMSVFLEHPASWAAVVYDATGDGTYSRVELAKRLKNNTALRQKVPHIHSVINQIMAEYEINGYDLPA